MNLDIPKPIFAVLLAALAIVGMGVFAAKADAQTKEKLRHDDAANSLADLCYAWENSRDSEVPSPDDQFCNLPAFKQVRQLNKMVMLTRSLNNPNRVYLGGDSFVQIGGTKVLPPPGPDGITWGRSKVEDGSKVRFVISEHDPVGYEDHLAALTVLIVFPEIPEQRITSTSNLGPIGEYAVYAYYSYGDSRLPVITGANRDVVRSACNRTWTGRYYDYDCTWYSRFASRSKVAEFLNGTIRCLVRRDGHAEDEGYNRNALLWDSVNQRLKRVTVLRRTRDQSVRVSDLSEGKALTC